MRSTLREQAAEGIGAPSPMGEQECATNLRKAAVLPRNIRMLEEGKTAVPVTGQHTTAYGSSQHQCRLMGFPFMPSALHFLILYKTRECVMRNQAACSSYVLFSLLWLVIKRHGLLTTSMLHKPRHRKFCRKLLSFTARSLFIKS